MLVLLVVLCLILPYHGAHAFGAGNIPSCVIHSRQERALNMLSNRYAFVEGRAFRHGDIGPRIYSFPRTLKLTQREEDTLGTIVKRLGAGFLNRGLKFGGLDTKRIYFG